jgi:mannose-6-phosphate isomerase
VSGGTALRPARLKPIFVPRIWGVRRLPAFMQPKEELREPVGEVWLAGADSVFADGPFAGSKIADVWPEMPQSWTGPRKSVDAPFPLLAKFLFPGDKLSVQVHPDDDYARANEAALGGTGKTEMWYALAAEPDSGVWAGLKPGVTRQVLRRAIDEGSVEECLARVPVSAGDAVFVPAGTAHMIGPGLVLCEIQQNSDITYRMHDFGRKTADGTTRPLHVEKSLAVLAFDRQHSGKLQTVHTNADGVRTTYLVACKYFAVEKWESAAPVRARTNGEHFEIWIALHGHGSMKCESSERDAPRSHAYSEGEAWFIPAGLGDWSIEPRGATTLLRAFVPDLEKYAAQLAERGISAETVKEIVK